MHVFGMLEEAGLPGENPPDMRTHKLTEMPLAPGRQNPGLCGDSANHRTMCHACFYVINANFNINY